MSEKKCPVDRGKLLIGLECHRHDDDKCSDCPYDESIYGGCSQGLAVDALAYIGWLEQRVEQLETDKANALMTIERELAAKDDPTAGAIITVPLKAISRNTLVKIHRDIGGLSGMSFSVPEGKFVQMRNQILREEATEDAGSDQ